LASGSLAVGDIVSLRVDDARRRRTRANHSATHILHEALRQVLGPHVAQKGSLVAPDRLRFDFSQPAPVSEEQIARVEDIANDVVLEDTPVETHLMAVDEAIASGALALFGEKYGDEVRVVAMGRPRGDGPGGRAFSVELCGGTHVGRTGQIGLIKVVAEQGVAAGVRRIEALTAEGARAHLEGSDRRLREIAAMVKAPPEEAPAKVAAALAERRNLERQVGDLSRKLALGGPQDTGQTRDVGGITVIAKAVHGVAPKDLRALVDAAKRQVRSGVVAMVGVGEDGRAGLVVGVTDDLTGAHDAVELARRGAAVLGGKGGGGRPDLAQAGGPDGARAEEALEAICSYLREVQAA
jgi:alanyl-tRNA synthetase